MKNRFKVSSAILAMVIILQLVVTGFADSWTCTKCGTENTGAFCGNCGASVAEASGAERKISVSRSEEWFCLKCGNVSTANFCTQCGNKRSANLVGSLVYFGAYEQDNNTSNGQEPIEWIVLDVQGSNALLISRYGLDAKPYNTEQVDVTWATCTLRAWMNKDFLNVAFSSEEQKAIVTTTVDNSRSQGNSEWSTSGGNNTQDKVFLLSYKEALTYFKDSDSRTCELTAYAKAEGGSSLRWWWLRSPGSTQSGAAYVNSNGALSASYVNSGAEMVRPTLIINLDSGLF